MSHHGHEPDSHSEAPMDSFDFVAPELSRAVDAFRAMGYKTFNEHAMPAIELPGADEASIGALLAEFQADRAPTLRLGKNSKGVLIITNALYDQMNTPKDQGPQFVEHYSDPTLGTQPVNHVPHTTSDGHGNHGPHHGPLRSANHQVAHFIDGHVDYKASSLEVEVKDALRELADFLEAKSGKLPDVRSRVKKVLDN